MLVPTFHPAFLLRNPGQELKRMAWDDLKLARREYDARRDDGGRTRRLIADIVFDIPIGHAFSYAVPGGPRR